MKNAFVKALSDSGVGADEIARIRRDLGLAAESGADKSLHERIPDASRPNLAVAASFDILNA